MITVFPRKALKDDVLINNFNPRNEIPLIGFLTNLLLNKKNDRMIKGDSVEIKLSTLRNFLRRKCHSENKNVLSDTVETFFSKIENLKNKIFHIFKTSEKSVDITFSKEYLKSLEKNTVSFNLFDLTKTRGLKAKMIFLKIIAFDMRDVKERFFTLLSVSKYLGLDCFNNRKNTIKMIKKALISLSKRGLIENEGYIGINKKDLNKNYRFIYKLSSLRQSMQ